MGVTDNFVKRLSGEARFITDILPTNLIFGHTIRAAIAKGEILSIQLPELPDGYFVLGYKDIPGKKKLILFKQEVPVLAEKTISYLGEPVLLLAGPSKSFLKELASRIRIEYNEEQPAFTPDAVSMNRLDDHIYYKTGEHGAAFADAEQIVSAEYTTAVQISYNIEPQCAIAIGDNNQILVYASCNYPFSVRDNIASILNMPKKKVRVIVPESCSPSGGKIIVPALIAVHVALLAYHAGKTVKIEYSQSEDISFGVKKYPFAITYHSAVNKEGVLTANRIRVQIDNGTSRVFNHYISQKIITTASRYYQCPHLELSLTFNSTNKAPLGGFNGIGETEICFATELQADKIARLFKCDPLSWKIKNLLLRKIKPGVPGPMAVLEKVVQLSDFKRKHGAYAAFNQKQFPGLPAARDRYRRGIGLALCPHHITTDIEAGNPTYHVEVVFDKDRKLRIKTSAIDMGDSKGVLFSTIASQSLNIHISEVVIEQVDTYQVPDSGATLGSKAVNILSKLVEQCCRAIQQKLKKEEPPIAVHKKFTAREHKNSFETTWEATVVEVEINSVTFEILCRGIWIVVDAGKIINPDIARNHIELTALQNYEYAHLDENDFEHFSNYSVTGSLDVPPINVEFIAHEEKTAVAQSLGDQPVCGVAPAYVNAIAQACSRDITIIPITPELIQNLQEKNENRI